LTASLGQQKPFSAVLTSQATLFASRNFGTGRPVPLTATNATFNSTTKKYGSHSLSLNNTTDTSQDAQIIFTNDNFNMEIPASTDFLIEFWFNLNGGLITAADRLLLGVGDMTTLANMNANDSWAFGINSAGRLIFKFATASNTFTTMLSAGKSYSGTSSWQHIVITRYGSTLSIVNNTQPDSASITYSGAIYQGSYKKLRFRNGFSYTVSTPTTSLLIDEFNFKIGYSSINGADGDTRDAQAQNDPDKSVVLYHFNNDLQDDVSATFNQAAALSSQFTETATLSGPVRASAALSAQAIQIAQGVTTKLADSAMTSSASMVVNASRTRDHVSNQNSQAQLSADAVAAKSGIAAISSQANLVIDYIRYRDAAIQTDAIFSELAAVAKVGDFLVTLESNFQQVTQAIKTVEGQVTAVSQFNQNVAAIKVVSAVSAMQAQAQMTTAANRIRDNSSSQSSQFAQTTQAIKTTNAVSAQSSQFTVIAQTSGIINATALLTSIASVVAQALRIQPGASVLSSVGTLSAEATKAVLASANLTSTASLTIPGETIKPASITTQAVASQLSIVVKVGSIIVDMPSQVTMTVNAVKTTANQIIAVSSTQLTAVAVKTAIVNSTMPAVTAFAAEGTTNITGEAHFTVQATLSADSDFRASAISLVASAGTMTVSATVTRRASGALQVQGFELVLGDRGRSTSAALTAQSTMTAAIGGLFNTSANLVTSGGILTVGNVIHITPALTYKIRAEDRVYDIREEDRLYEIRAENRTYRVKN
jgi:hypothetical protein